MITVEHEAFARAVVALAREHGASMVTMKFRLASCKRFLADRAQWDEVDIAWTEGRHGGADSIELRTQAKARISETATPGGT